jgi:hypothetical protein
MKKMLVVVLVIVPFAGKTREDVGPPEADPPDRSERALPSFDNGRHRSAARAGGERGIAHRVPGRGFNVQPADSGAPATTVPAGGWNVVSISFPWAPPPAIAIRHLPPDLERLAGVGSVVSGDTITNRLASTVQGHLPPPRSEPTDASRVVFGHSHSGTALPAGTYWTSRSTKRERRPMR